VEHVALLRGFSPLHPNMRNARLREVVAGLGFDHVATVISSGNVVFDAPPLRSDRARLALERRLEAAWLEQLDFASSTIVRSRPEIEAMVDGDPFAGFVDERSSSCNVTFLKQEPPPDLELPSGARGDATVVAIRLRAVYSVLDLTGPTPAFMRTIDRTFGAGATTRTWRTVLRLARAMSTD
jgi:uncharacterized protein (DUF1697 family)